MKTPSSRTLSSCLTYMLKGNNNSNLYVPLTGRCNSLTLPETRGPGFLLPPHVVSSLLHVRDAECGTERWKDLRTRLDSAHPESTRVPPPPYTAEEIRRLRTPPWHRAEDDGDDDRFEALHDEIIDRIRRNDPPVAAVVMGGEGEPTLRLERMLRLVRDLRETAEKGGGSPLPPVRVTTNGLVGEEGDVARRLVDGGVSGVSVFLTTGGGERYDGIVDPSPPDGRSRACGFVRRALEVGLDVEVTAVAGGDVDKEGLEESLRRDVGPCSVRWRPYFE